MKNIKVSVIVPVYNKEKYLKECIDSILGQDYRQIELILVDDASTDGSGAICDHYASKENVKVIHQENGGPTAACVRGMQEAQGAYFMFVDSDDYIDAKTISFASTWGSNSGWLCRISSFASSQQRIWSI